MYKSITMSNYKSIVYTQKRCYNCGTTYMLTVDHLLGGNTRKLCNEDKLVVPLCFKCHRAKTDDPKWTLKYRQLGQRVYEEQLGSREQFIKRYGKSFL